jgi:hypothetical protein
MPSSVIINKFDNEPFIRQLTATATGVSNSDELIWFMPLKDLVSVKSLTNNQPYSPNTTTGSALSTSTLVISFTSTTYDYINESYTLETFPISCVNTSVQPNTIAGTSIIYDTFPDISFNLGINFEKTDNKSYFYRLTSTVPFSADIKFLSNAFNFQDSLSTAYYDSWYTINNTTTKNRDLTAYSQTGFNRTVKGLSSINATLCAWSVENSLSSFYTPHRFERSLSAVFVPNFLSANFIGWPQYYFANIDGNLTLFTLTSSGLNYEVSPGLEFYGEGHTETIFLSAQTTPNTTQYLWRLNNSISQYPVLNNNSTGVLTSVRVSVSSDLGSDFKIPISLHTLNSEFLSTDPFFFFDDITGEEKIYPYIATTIDSFGNELNTNTKFKRSILVKPYDPVQFRFVPGVNSEIYLPIDTTVEFFQSSLFTFLSGTSAAEPCYGKYGLQWKWSEFENCSTFLNKPSSWSSTQCTLSTFDETGQIIPATPGLFPKKWQIEPPLSAEVFNINPINCIIDSGITWTLSASTGWSILTGPITFSDSYNFSLRLKDFGLTPFTTNYFENTNLIINAKQDVTCQIVRETIPNDWLPRTRTVDASFNFVSISPPNIRLYTPNKYVLTDTNVFFENLTINQNLIQKIIFDFDEDNIFTFNNFNDIPKIFNIKYNQVGRKNIKVIANLTYTTIPVILNIPNMIEALEEYDTVDPLQYRSTSTPITLPWSNKPKIYSNDWAVEDNINICFKKFFENLEYLDSIAKTYLADSAEYYGYLGSVPTIFDSITACPTWVWEDVDCFNPDAIDSVTWNDVFRSDNINESGRFVDCGTWEQQECSFKKSNPICTEKYCVEWNWRQRKCKNTNEPITWKQAKCTGPLAKRWYFEPCQDVRSTITVCDEGSWNVNLPGLDRYLNTIATNPLKRCYYNGITSKNNILYCVQNTQIKLLSSDYTATYFDYLNTLDGVTAFANLKNICLDSQGKIFVLDNILSQVAVYVYDRENIGSNFRLFINWGGIGSVATKNKFFSPNDIHIDQFDKVWVTDTGNKCIKHFTNSGAWLKTIFDEGLEENIPLSVAVDSSTNIHILTNKNIRVYSYEGEFLYEYNFNSLDIPVRLNSSNNREIIYVAFEKQVLKYFRNGVFAGYIIQEKENINKITSLYHDEFRNLLITSEDKILKYPDIMTLLKIKGDLPDSYWQLNDILIHKDEYIQNWVYTKSFERLWDNIEIFKNTLHFTTDRCKTYKPPVHEKNKMIIGQNEIVTAAVINRVLTYLWENFLTILDFFDPSCEN